MIPEKVAISPNHLEIKLCCYLTNCYRWRGGTTGRALDLRLTGRGFKSYSGQKLRNNLGQVVNTYVPLSPSSVTWYRPKRRCSAAGKVTAGLAESSGSLLSAGWPKSPAGWLPVHQDQLRAQRSVTSMGSRFLPFTTLLCHFMYFSNIVNQYQINHNFYNVFKQTCKNCKISLHDW